MAISLLTFYVEFQLVVIFLAMSGMSVWLWMRVTGVGLLVCGGVWWLVYFYCKSKNWQGVPCVPCIVQGPWSCVRTNLAGRCCFKQAVRSHFVEESFHFLPFCFDWVGMPSCCVIWQECHLVVHYPQVAIFITLRWQFGGKDAILSRQ